jgi:hypothetical protein
VPHHRPETKIVSINTSGADSSGIPIDESLPLLSFFEENTHSQPVYWSVPVLSTRIYPLYSDNLWSEVRAEQPLIVEYRDGGYRPADIPGYVVLVGAQAVFGYWYLYAPERDRRESQADQSVFLARDGSTESAGTKEGAGAKADASLSPSPVGAWRGMTSSTAGSSNSYTWPADLPSAAPEGALEQYRICLAGPPS